MSRQDAWVNSHPSRPGFRSLWAQEQQSIPSQTMLCIYIHVYFIVSIRPNVRTPCLGHFANHASLWIPLDPCSPLHPYFYAAADHPVGFHCSHAYRRSHILTSNGFKTSTRKSNYLENAIGIICDIGFWDCQYPQRNANISDMPTCCPGQFLKKT